MDGIRDAMKMNFGQVLVGDRIHNAPYELHFLVDAYCHKACIANVGRGEHPTHLPNKVARAIHLGYHNNWILDNLPSASKSEDDLSVKTAFHGGFPVGFVGDDGYAYLHNHVNIEVVYRNDIPDDYYIIVQFVVQPFSIHHDIEPFLRSEAWGKDVAEISKPIPSCDVSAVSRYGYMNHTTYNMTATRPPQLASGKVLFTYDVIWVEDPHLTWSSRWDSYLDTGSPWSASRQKLAANAVVFAGLLAVIFVFKLRRHASQYSSLPAAPASNDLLNSSGEDDDSIMDHEPDWKLVFSNVVRPPTTCPLVLCVCCGTGAQLLCTTTVTLFFASLGYMSPARRGRIVMVPILLFCLFGIVAGYTSARFHKTFGGFQDRRTTFWTAIGFPGLCAIVFFVTNLCAILQVRSTQAVPLSTVVVLLVVWLSVLAPLVFLGAAIGNWQGKILFPTQETRSPMLAEEEELHSIPFALLLCGAVPFGLFFNELGDYLGVIWNYQVSYKPGFDFLLFILLLIIAAEVAAVFHCVQLIDGCKHRWWWRSFASGGGVALWVFLYSVHFFGSHVYPKSWSFCIYYFGFMSFFCSCIFLALGFVGLVVALAFNRICFAAFQKESLSDNHHTETELPLIVVVEATPAFEVEE